MDSPPRACPLACHHTVRRQAKCSARLYRASPTAARTRRRREVPQSGEPSRRRAPQEPISPDSHVDLSTGAPLAVVGHGRLDERARIAGEKRPFRSGGDDADHTQPQPPSPNRGTVAMTPGYALCALRYAAMTEAGILPRSLTVSPLSRAQERTSALLGEPSDRGARSVLDLPVLAAAAAGRDRAFLTAEGRFCAFALFLEGLLASFSTNLITSCSPSETSSVTPYIAPTTRMASSRGSVESSVIFKASGLSTFRDAATPGRQNCIDATSISAKCPTSDPRAVRKRPAALATCDTAA
jgi:hypothetical protein